MNKEQHEKQVRELLGDEGGLVVVARYGEMRCDVVLLPPSDSRPQDLNEIALVHARSIATLMRASSDLGDPFRMSPEMALSKVLEMAEFLLKTVDAKGPMSWQDVSESKQEKKNDDAAH